MSQVQALVDEKVRQALLTVGKSHPDSSNKNNTRNNGSIKDQNRNRRKKRQREAYDDSDL